MFPSVPWRDFPRYMQWEQGEHVTMIAPTGQGKTTLALELLPLRSFVMVLATKRRDATLNGLAKQGYKTMREPHPQIAPRAIVKPPFPRDPDAMFAAHRATFKAALTVAYRTGGWCIFADEVRYLADQLKLKSYLELLWLQGRSLGVSLVAATQRPRHIPLEAYDAATHLFFWRDSDMGNIKRIAEISGDIDTAAIMGRIPELPQYQFVYVNTRTGRVYESKVEK